MLFVKRSSYVLSPSQTGPSTSPAAAGTCTSESQPSPAWDSSDSSTSGSAGPVATSVQPFDDSIVDSKLSIPDGGVVAKTEAHHLLKWQLCGTSIGVHPSGFRNSGNSCYVASVVQLLAYTPPFAQLIAAAHEPSTMPIGNPAAQISHAISSSICRIHSAGHRILYPNGILKLLPFFGSSSSKAGPKFINGRQEDANEFLLAILGSMHQHQLQSYNGMSQCYILYLPHASQTISFCQCSNYDIT